MANALNLDLYVVDTLLPDLVGHDKRPSSFLVYLCLYRRAVADFAAPIRLSHQALADATGLSRSAVQTALANLTRRGLIDSHRSSPTAVPRHVVHRPWIRRGKTTPQP